MISRLHSSYLRNKHIYWLWGLTLLMLTVGLIPLFCNFRHLSLFDFTSQQIPFILETKRMFASGTPWWSWNTFSGDNFIASYSFYTVTSPFVWIACLFPVDKILGGILFALYLKTLCCTSFAYLYFRRMSFSPNLSIIGALLYTFSSFYITNLHYFHFAEPVLVFPLLLLSIEGVLQNDKRRWIWLALASFVVVFINFYFAGISFILGGLYFLLRSYSLKVLSWTLILKAIGSVLLGIGIASFIMFPVLLHVFGITRSQPRVTDSLLHSFSGYTFGQLMEFYCVHLRILVMPSFSEVMPVDSIPHESWNFSKEGYITLFGLLPAAVYVVRKRDWLSLLLIILFICYLTPLNGIFSFFTSPRYTRWLYGLIMFGVLATLYILRDNKKISTKELLLYLGFCGVVIFGSFLSHRFGEKPEETIVLSNLRQLHFLLFGINIICLLVWFYNQKKQQLTIGLITLCGTLNMACFSFAVSHLPEVSDPVTQSNYRSILFEEDYGGISNTFVYRYDDETIYNNISLLQNRPGIYSFHSVYNKHLESFRRVLDWANGDSFFYNNQGNRSSVAALMSVKELKVYKDSIRFANPHEEGLILKKRTPHYDLYDFSYYIPMGFAYDSYVTKDELMNAKAPNESFDAALLMLENLAIQPEDVGDLSRFMRHGTVGTNLNIDSIVNQRRVTTVKDFRGDSKGFTARSDFDSDKVVFFSVAADPGFTAYIDNTPTKIYNVNLGMSAIVVPSGNHTIRFEYFPPGLKTGCIVSLLSLLILIGLIICPKFLPKKRTGNYKEE